MLITLEDLTTAIQKALDIERDEAYKFATLILDFFGFEDRIVDNILTSEERQMFYQLQEKGLLSAQREEIVLPTGSPWRIHYWLLEKKTILYYGGRNASRIKKSIRVEEEPRSMYEDIYLSVPKELWAARKTLDV
jgi:hypothetical protein